MLLGRTAVMQIGPLPTKELKATTYFLNVFVISVIMALVFIAILDKELTRRRSAGSIVRLEEERGRMIEGGPTRIAVEAQLVARNRGSIPTRIRKIDYSIYVGDVLVGRSSQAGGTTIPPGPTVTLTRTLDLPLKAADNVVGPTEAGGPPCKVMGALHIETSSGDAKLPFSFEVVGGWS